MGKVNKRKKGPLAFCHFLPPPPFPKAPQTSSSSGNPHPNLQGLEGPASRLLPSQGARKSIWQGPRALAGGIC